MGVGGLGNYFYKLTKNPNLKKKRGGGGWGRVSLRTCTNVSNGSSTLQGKQLCQIIPKYMHTCRNSDHFTI